MEQTPQTELVTVCDVQFRNNSKIYFFDPSDLQVQTGDHLIIDTSRGPEYGVCTRGNHTVTQKELVAPLRKVLRIANEHDSRINEENRIREKRAFDICLKKIEELKLDMQLVSTEYAFDGSKILFFFTADGRVDFRELVRILASILHTRIELRQIGVRDKAKMVGGLGICGRPFCCREFLEDFQPVSIKMAKTQNLSLNPTKISGTCGRLMCCLNYEQEAYEDLHANSPKPDSFVDTPDGRGTITNVHLLRQSVDVRLEKQPDTIVCHKNCDICVLRSGKAKKTDEPIPEDLAPISGNKQKKQEEKTTFSAYLEPVARPQEKADAKQRRKKSVEAKPVEPKAAEPKPVKQEEAPAKKEKKPFKKDNKPKKQEAPVAEAEAPKTKPEAPKAKPEAPKAKPEAQTASPDAQEGAAPKQHKKHYHHYHKRRKPNQKPNGQA